MQSCRVLVRALSSSSARTATTRLKFDTTAKQLAEVPGSSGYKKVMDLQKLMCADDGLLVWQKRGGRDIMPYYLSMTLMSVGVAWAFYNIFVLSFPQKEK